MIQYEYKILEFTTGMFAPGQVREKVRGGAGGDTDLLDSVTFREVGEVRGMLGGIKKVPIPLGIQKIEMIFNELGKEGWSLCETVPLVTNVAHAFRYGTRTTAVQFIFKREIE